MTEEEKRLLLKDLCARLAYGVMIYLHTSSDRGSTIVLNSDIYGFIEDVLNNGPYEIKEIKPYLRPLSSMTEEEKAEYTSYCFEQPFLQKDKTPNLGSVPMCIDWLIANHFDYRGLIPMGLALEAKEGMYK